MVLVACFLSLAVEIFWVVLSILFSFLAFLCLALSGFLSFTVSSVILSGPLVCVAAYSLTSLMVLLSPWKSLTVTVCCCLANISSIICCCHELCLRSVSLSSHSKPPSSSLLSPSLPPCCVSLGIYCRHMISLVSYPSAWKLVWYFHILACGGPFMSRNRINSDSSKRYHGRVTSLSLTMILLVSQDIQ